jgi:hypothetical protein
MTNLESLHTYLLTLPNKCLETKGWGYNLPPCVLTPYALFQPMKRGVMLEALEGKFSVAGESVKVVDVSETAAGLFLDWLAERKPAQA